MSMPGFTADAAVQNAGARYQIGSSREQSFGAVQPARLTSFSTSLWSGGDRDSVFACSGSNRASRRHHGQVGMPGATVQNQNM